MSGENVEDSFLRKVRSKTSKDQFESFYKQWFYSSEAVSEVKNAVNRICKLIDERFYPNQNEYLSQGISLYEKMYYRSIENDSFGCKIELKNYETATHLNESPYKIFLDITLFQKSFITPATHYLEERLGGISLYPDITFEREIIWKNSRDESNTLSTKEISNEFFKLFINRLKKISK